jgi:ribosomal protein S18 acetylase RimI-like enzyme
MGLELRDCRRSDLEGVCKIEQICYGSEHALPRIALTQYFDLFEPAFTLAEASSELVGFAVGGIALHTDFCQGWLLDIAVLPNFQGQGVGEAVCRRVLDQLTSLGIRSVHATVAPDNRRSLKLLTRLGFQKSGDVAEYFGPGERRLLMEWGANG